jgi:hypothetical protein
MLQIVVKQQIYFADWFAIKLKTIFNKYHYKKRVGKQLVLLLTDF